MKKFLSIFAVLGLILVLAACGADNKEKESEGSNDQSNEANESSESTTLTIKHELGETPVKKNPEKVVVFDYGALDTLDKLGIEVAGVAKQSLPGYLSKYDDDKYENIGGLKEPDFEKINEMKPDLIIISGRQSDMYEDLSEIAPTIHLGVDATRYMESFKENVGKIAEIFGKEDAVDAEIKAVEEKIAGINEKATASDKKALIVLANEGKVSAYGPGSRFGIIHDVFGFKAADEGIEASTHGQSITFEYILETNPDILFVIDRSAAVGGEVGAKDTIENELVQKTNAYKDGKIIYLDPEYWYLSGGGLESVAAMVDEVEPVIE